MVNQTRKACGIAYKDNHFRLKMSGGPRQVGSGKGIYLEYQLLLSQNCLIQAFPRLLFGG